VSAVLRASAPLVPHVPRRHAKAHLDPARTAFGFGFAAVMVHFAVSANLLAVIGIDYASPGGNPIVKLHPAFYLAALGAGASVALAPRPWGAVESLFRQKPGVVSFLILIFGCAVYSIFSVGISGSAVYVDSLFSAGLLACALEPGSPRARRILGYSILAFALVNVLISVGESLVQTQLIPPMLDGKVMPDMPGSDFRGAALYDHPLTGAMVTSMAVFLLLAMQLRPWISAPAFTLLLLGLLAFGGRAALLVTVLMLVASALFVLVRGLVARRLAGRFVAAVCGALLVIVPLAFVVVSSTTIGQRIVDHFYVDDSAEVRNIQWKALNYLTPRDVLLGTTQDALTSIKAQIGLLTDSTDIENFWLLIFINLGVFGFACFLVGFLAFLVHLGRATSAVGWMLLVSTIITASASNSLGRKSDILCFMTACMIAAARTRQPSKVGARSAVKAGRGAGTPPRGGLQSRPVTTAAGRNLSPVPRPRAGFSTLTGHPAR
jgi:hypothetical protein